MDHAVVATKFTDRDGKEALAASHRQLRGYLVDSNGRIIKTISPGPPKPGKADRITLGELLEAAGVQTLDQPADGLDARGRSYRERGCILRVTIFYQNWMSRWVVGGGGGRPVANLNCLLSFDFSVVNTGLVLSSK